MNDINLLMQRIDDINSKGPGELTTNDIDVIIAYHRNQRARRAAGIKAEKPKVDISAIMSRIAPASVKSDARPMFTRKL